MNVLVTGANGFVGRHLCRHLANCGATVTGLVRSSPGAAAVAGSCARTVVGGNLGRDFSLPGEVLHGQEAVVHLAARVHVMRETEVDPDQAFSEINVLGTERLARLAAEAGVRRFLLLSTIKVNGEGSETVAYRGDDPPAPQDAYARSKWEAEQRLWRVCRETGLQGVVLRPPLVYGPGVGGNFLRLLRLAAKGWPLPFGCAAGQRSLLSVGNLADAIQRCLSHPAAVGRTFTLSDDHDLTTRELLTLLSAALGRSGPLLPIPAGFMRGLLGAMGQGAVADRLFGALRVDCREIRSQLDWTPPFSVEEAIQRTTAWFRDGEGESLRRS